MSFRRGSTWPFALCPQVQTGRLALNGLVLSTLALIALLPGVQAQAAAPLLQAASLQPTFGGVLLQARFVPRGNGALNGVWADSGRANLMRCAPSCAIVSSIPLNSSVTFSQSSTYRVVLGGDFKPRQKVKLLLRFVKGDPLTVTVPVAGK